MRKTKWTRLAAMALSAAMVFSSLQLPAFATENENPGIVQTVTPDNEEDTFDDTGDVPTIPADDSITETERRGEPELTALAEPSATDQHVQDENDGHEEVRPSDEELGTYNGTPTPMNVYTDRSPMTRSIAAYGSGSKISIDPSDLTNWYVFDHYDRWFDRMDSNTSARKTPPSDWGAANVWNNNKAFDPAKHPWFYYSMASAQYQNEKFNLSDPAQVAAYEQRIFGIYNTNSEYASTHLSQHIYTSGTKDNPSMNFTGYVSPGYVDWVLADIPSTNTDLKSIAFDIDAKYVVPHSMDGFGIFLNAGVAGDTFKGHALYFKASGSPFLNSMTPSIIDMSAGTSASAMHDNPYGTSASWYEGSVTGSGVNIPTLDANGNPKPGTAITFSGTSKKIHIDIQVGVNAAGKQEMTLVVTPYITDSQMAANPIINYTKELADTGFASFGPFADHKSHGCNRHTFVSFSAMQLSTNLDVYFWTDTDRGSMFHKTAGVEKGESLQSMFDSVNSEYPNPEDNPFKMPKAPSQPGKAFLGWVDDKGQPFDVHSPINSTTNVYAVWGDNGVSVAYNPNNQWTNKDVEIILDVVTGYQPISVTVDLGDGVAHAVTTTKDDTTGKYIGILSTPNNFTGGTVTAVLSDGQGGEDIVSANLAVTWIDKVAPTVANLPGNDPTTGLLEASAIKNQVAFADAGSPNANLGGQQQSNINNTTKTVHFFNEEGTAIVKSIPWDQLEQGMKDLPGGMYSYAVSVLDHAGNYGDSNGKTGDGSTVPEKPTEDLIAINATKPTITETGRSATTWTNQDVTVDYIVKSTTPLIDVTADGKPITNPNTPQTGQLVYTENGTKTVDAVNQPNLSATEDFIVGNIDKNPPSIQVNIPSRVDTPAQITDGLAYNDPKDGNGVASGIQNETETLYIYKNENDTTPFMTIPMKDLESKWNDIPSGKYHYAVSVKDKANNYTDSNGKTISNPPGTTTTPETPDKPTGELIMKAEKPQIDLTATNKDGSYTSGTWSKTPVTVEYDVTSDIKLDNVTENGNNKTINGNDGKTHNDKVVVDKDGQYPIKIEAENEVGEAVPKEIHVWIDGTKPIVNYPNNPQDIEDIIDGMDFTDATSGPKDGSEIITILDEKGNPVPGFTGNKDDIELKLPDLPTGEYIVVTTVEDEAGNVSDPKKTGTLPHVKPGDSGLKIQIEYFAPEADGDTNQDVKATYKITSALPLTSVTIGGQAISVNGKKAEGSMIFKINEDKPIVAKNASGVADTMAKVTWIDKVNPKAELPASNTMFDANDVKLYDVSGGTSYKMSGIESGKTEFIAIPYIDGKPTTDTSEHVTITNVGETQISTTVAANLEEGTVYDLTLVGADRATNPSNTAVAKSVLYVTNKETPPTVNANEFSIVDLKSDLGSSMKSVRITNTSTSTTGLTIKDVHVKIGSVDTGSGVIQTSAGASKRTVDVHFRKPANGQPVVFVVYLYTGAIVEVPYVSTGPALKTDHADLKQTSSVTASSFTAAFNSGSIKWDDGTSILPAKLSVYYKNGNVMTKTTTARLAALCATTERQIFIVAQDTSGNYHYLGENNSNGDGLPTATANGIKVQGR